MYKNNKKYHSFRFLFKRLIWFVSRILFWNLPDPWRMAWAPGGSTTPPAARSRARRARQRWSHHRSERLLGEDVFGFCWVWWVGLVKWFCLTLWQTNFDDLLMLLHLWFIYGSFMVHLWVICGSFVDDLFDVYTWSIMIVDFLNWIELVDLNCFFQRFLMDIYTRECSMVQQ